MEDEILNDFLVESNENLSRLDQEFVQLEKDSGNRDLLASIFRTIHTIKGTAGFFNFEKLISITHFAEDILAKMRDGRMSVTPGTMDVLLAGVDAVKELLAEIEASSGEGAKDYSGLVKQLERVANGEAAPRVLPEAPVLPPPATSVRFKNRPKTVVAQPAALVAAPAPVVEVKLPEPEAIAAPAPIVAPVPEGVTLPTPAPSSRHRPNVAESNIRVEVGLLDRLMNLVGELVLTRNQILQFAGSSENKTIASSSQRLNLITTELQENVMKTRMQPIRGVWNKIPRVVRDVSHALGKEVDLQLDGAETELDKTILEAVKDPFTHIVRNALDHGIELPEERVRKGKSRRGMIRLRAFHEGGQVNIEVSDDGAGINIDKVKRKAIEQRLITEEQAARMTEREAIHLICRPGFSTAEKVTQISGRGVGMDVVKTNIEKIGGNVDILNNPTAGTTLKIKIPLTLAIIPALIVSAKGIRFAIPQINLRELVRLEGNAAREGIEWIQGVEVYRLRGNLLPLIRLRRALKLDTEESDSGNDIVNIVVLSADNKLFGLVVDNVNDTEEIVVKPLAKALKNIHVFAGSTIMGDGQVALILDTAGLLESSEAHDTHAEKFEDEIVERCQDQSTLLLFTLNNQSRFAMPLSVVSRLEEFQSSKIERSTEGEVVQYRGQVMPLLRMANLVGISDVPESYTLPVIVFSNGERSVGMAVHRLLDIVDEIERPSSESAQPGILGTAIIQGATTVFVDPYALIEAAMPGYFNRKPGLKASQKSRRRKLGKILLVDDNPFFRNLTRTYLELAGYAVVEALTDSDALQRLNGTRIDYIISDLETPAVDGCALARAVQDNSKLCHIPLLAMTSQESEHDRQRAIDAGFAACLVKIDRRQLLTAVAQLEHSKIEPQREKVLVG